MTKNYLKTKPVKTSFVLTFQFPVNNYGSDALACFGFCCVFHIPWDVIHCAKLRSRNPFKW